MDKVDFETKREELVKPAFVDNPAAAERIKASENVNTDEITAIDSETTQPSNRAQLAQYDVDEVWKIIQESLRMHVSERDRTVWYKNVYLESLENGVAQLSCDNPMKREWIESNHRAFIRNKLEEVIGYKPDLMINIRSSIKQAEEAPEADENSNKAKSYEYHDPYNQTSNLSTSSAKTQDQQDLFSAKPSSQFKPNLHDRYQMGNFVIGDSNQLAYAVAEGVVQNPGHAYNPVFYYGPSGVGKTHLMQAIGNAMLENNPTAKIVYVPIETFLNDLVEAIRTNKQENFRKKYRPIDLLMIDDIQFISTFKKTTEELFNTFNALYQNNKQIIIASDRPPKEIENLPDRMRTRFEGGMVVDIQHPNLETRLAILRQRAQDSDVQVPDEIMMFIAQNIDTSVRELEGAMTKVITKMKFSNEEPDIDEIAKMLEVDVETKRRRIKPERILTVVSEVFDVPEKEIKGRRRTAYVALSRQVAMYLLREILELPLEKVARTVNRKDHTTVIHACEKVEELVDSDENVNTKVDKCKTLLQG